MIAREALADKLQVVIPLVERLAVTARQSLNDATAAVQALKAAVDLLRPPAPMHERERHVRSLEIAITRSGKTWTETSFLSGIPENRLRLLAAGAKPTDEERASLLRCLPDWKSE